jgi:hypothetical protein
MLRATTQGSQMQEHKWPPDLLRDVDELYSWSPAPQDAWHHSQYEQVADEDLLTDIPDDHGTLAHEGAAKPPILTLKTWYRDKQVPPVGNMVGHEIPSSTAARPKRSLILCFDGTGNKFQGSTADSNSRKLMKDFNERHLLTECSCKDLQPSRQAGRKSV